MSSFIYRELLYNCPVTCYTLEQIKQPKIRRRDRMNLFELYNVLKDGQKGRNNFLVTVIQGNGTGSRYFLADGEVKAQCGSGDIETERLRELVQPGESGIAEADGRRLFVESLKQPAHLVICGAGHVAQQVILLAGKVGFTVTVLEDRVSFAGEALPVHFQQ